MNHRIRHRSLVGFAILLHAARGDEDRGTITASANVFRGDAPSKAELFAHWTAEKINNAVPLDLKIDPRSGEGFVTRDDGLVSYAAMFAAETQRMGSDASSLVRLDKMFDREALLEEMEAMHFRRNRIGGGREHHARELDGRRSKIYVLDLASIEFKTVSSRNRGEQGDERRLTAADGFATHNRKKQSKKDKKEKIKQDKNGNEEDEVESGIKDQNEGGKKKFLPKINELSPPRGEKIQSSQTFSARVTPSSSTLASIQDVTFRLVDPGGESSDWLPLSRGYDEDLYEITIEGFEAFPASKWKYQMAVRDEEGRSVESSNIMFKVDGNVGYGLETVEDDWAESVEPTEPSGVETGELISSSVVGDSNWPYGGGIQSATGRILFEFDGSGTYVCSGTVVHDGDISGRSIILTAAHCAYNDSMKKFATKAIFIPDQVDTRGSKSDFNCRNDKYGCWELSFAVVSNGWASNSFPDNVEYDYAFYVVMDGVGAHSNGYEGGMSGTLDQDTVPMQIDFGSDPKNGFAFALGYSADKDPSFRYCTNDISTIKGVPWYTNLWIDQCGMTGGASGGSWLVNMNTDGVGTIVSVNSWGFTDKVGMAGPQLQTSSGSLAECLFEEAKYSNDPGNVGGYIVDC